jgi:hypothetical protein
MLLGWSSNWRKSRGDELLAYLGVLDEAADLELVEPAKLIG